MTDTEVRDHIIADYEENLVEMRKYPDGWAVEIRENEMIISALRAQAEQENPQPLTLEQLRECGRNGKPIWTTMGDYGNPQCRVLLKYFDDANSSSKRFLFTDGAILHAMSYGDWLAYDHMPKEAE